MADVQKAFELDGHGNIIHGEYKDLDMGGITITTTSDEIVKLNAELKHKQQALLSLAEENEKLKQGVEDKINSDLIQQNATLQSQVDTLRGDNDLKEFKITQLKSTANNKLIKELQKDNDTLKGKLCRAKTQAKILKHHPLVSSHDFLKSHTEDLLIELTQQ